MKSESHLQRLYFWPRCGWATQRGPDTETRKKHFCFWCRPSSSSSLSPCFARDSIRSIILTNSCTHARTHTYDRSLSVSPEMTCSRANKKRGRRPSSSSSLKRQSHQISWPSHFLIHDIVCAYFYNITYYTGTGLVETSSFGAFVYTTD